MAAFQQDSFWSVIYTDNDPLYWKTVYGPTGALKAFVGANKRAAGGAIVPMVVCSHRGDRI